MESVGNKKASRIFVGVGALVALALAVFLARFVTENVAAQEFIMRLGYEGLFLVAVGSGFNVIPVPAIVLVPALIAAGFSLWPTVFVFTLGMTLGDVVGFLVGRVGRHVLDPDREHGRISLWIEAFRKKHVLGPYMFLFLYASVAPTPNELVVIPMSFAGYHFRYMIPLVLLGNFIFNTLAALGLLSLSGMLG